MDSKWRARIRRAALGILVFLVIQFVLGMTMNLFTSFPTYPGNAVQPADYVPLLAGHPILLAHYVIGILVFIGSIAVVGMSFASKDRKLSAISAIGFLGMLIAFASGIQFLVTAFTNDIYSYTMSLGFIVAVVAYFAMFYFTKQAG
ncbi:MAG: hypothetical protein KGI06_03775 [Candidatus Micrarchaeota archaeon]|nr:hypothetical protein [Candidatus Micrarchaeota archaeon]